MRQPFGKAMHRESNVLSMVEHIIIETSTKPLLGHIINHLDLPGDMPLVLVTQAHGGRCGDIMRTARERTSQVSRAATVDQQGAIRTLLVERLVQIGVDCKMMGKLMPDPPEPGHEPFFQLFHFLGG
jgi:hypothetical protein